MRLNLSSDGVRNCKETTMFVKEREKIIECKKKEILNLECKKGLLFEKSEKLDKVREMYKQMEQVKLVKMLEKYRSGNEF